MWQVPAAPLWRDRLSNRLISGTGKETEGGRERDVRRNVGWLGGGVGGGQGGKLSESDLHFRLL